ncbi:ABC transporter substrate-binding protein [Microbacterium amylolyticum]|uniref:Iron(III) transport system substrate-binding protein n=1 Tax=Microbacterium amylolyticum TaxID=936337 RepID=A0ABS4ZKI1_9MICO|nr:ABC transporter substrate-binding protein [Microbacterium amylolyticum]MBP2437717.1 iron(III) transport system substrate-binding protein [Microbacterium amylolyticum]
MNRYARRTASGAAALLGISLVATSCAGQAPAGTAADDTSDVFSSDLTLDELIERAQQEGPITIYDGTSKVEAMAEAFSEQYGIDATGVKADAAEVIEKTTREAQSGNIVADVVALSDLPALKSQLLPSGFVTTWVPSDLEDSIDESMREPLVLITDPSFFTYNSEVYDTCPVDNVWQLTEPEWSGAFAIDDPVGSNATLDWFSQIAQFGDDELRAAYEEAFGEELTTTHDSAAAEWISRLAANEPIITKSSEEASEAVGALGQTQPPMGLMSSAKYRNIDEKGYALAVCDGLSPWTGRAAPKGIAIATGTASPHAAMLFVHYALTQEGIEPQISDGKISSNRDVIQPEDPANTADHLETLFHFNNAGLDTDWADREVWQDLWRTSAR